MIRYPHTVADSLISDSNEQEMATTPLRFMAIIKGARAFTLVELVMVVAIIAVLATVALPAGLNYVEKVRKARCMGELQILNNEIQSYFIEKNAYPASLNDIGRGTFIDPWKEPYQYTNIDSGGPPLMGSIDQLNPGNDYDLYSKGSDRQTSTPGYVDATCSDDIVRASDGSFFGNRGDF